MTHCQNEALVSAGELPSRVVIVGDTESAWMAAACLGRQLLPLGCRVTIITSGQWQPEFAGESSRSSLHGLLTNLQADEHEFMRSGQATWRVATQFSDWVQLERDFWMPVSSDELQLSTVALFQSWFAERSGGRTLRPFHSYSMNWGAALAGKAPYGFSGPSPIARSHACSYHLDSVGFAAWLRQVSASVDVEVLEGQPAGIVRNQDGGIAEILLASGAVVEADLFVDATGADSWLLRQLSTTPFESWQDPLLCDRSVSVRLAGRRQIPAFTQITGMLAGWSWLIPLADTLEAGYQYASAYASPDDAWIQLQSLLRMNGLLSGGDAEELAGENALIPHAECHRAGRHSSFWLKNVVALGTAACHLTPLVSAGRHLTQLGIELLLELFPARCGTGRCADYYNERMRLAADEIRDFTQLHFLLSRREDTAFWQAARTAPVSEALQQRLALYEACGTVGTLAPEAIGEAEYLGLLAGCGRFPGQPSLRGRSLEPEQTQQKLRELLKANEAVLRELPLHEELLDWIHIRPGLSSESRSGNGPPARHPSRTGSSVTGL